LKRAVAFAAVAAIPAITLVIASSVGAASSPSSPAIKTNGVVSQLAADGGRAVFMTTQRGRWQIVVWEPLARRVTPIHTVHDPGCSRYCGPGGGLTIAGTRIAWDEAGSGNILETGVSSVTLANHKPVELGAASWDWSSGGGGDEVLAPHGDGRLLAFTIQVRCADPDSGGDPPCPEGRQADDVVSATIWRIARHGRCPTDPDEHGHCARVARAKGQLSVLAVDAGRIAALTDDGVRLLTAAGRRLRDFPVEKVRAAALSGNRLALRVGGGVSVYDTSSGELVFREEGGSHLEDLQSGILVTTAGKAVVLRKLEGGRVATIPTRHFPHAQLEASGLFVADGQRVTFKPMSVVLRRLG
jgi:hypothetical protein